MKTENIFAKLDLVPHVLANGDVVEAIEFTPTIPVLTDVVSMPQQTVNTAEGADQ